MKLEITLPDCSPVRSVSKVGLVKRLQQYLADVLLIARTSIQIEIVDG